MSKKWLYVTCFVLVLGWVGNAFGGLLGDPALVVYYDFEEFANNATVLDKSGKGNDATVVGTVNGLAGAGIRDTEACQITGNGSYLDLDGQNFPPEYIGTTAFTFACWVKPENTGGTQTVFSALATPHSWSHGGYIRDGQYHTHVSDIDNNWIINPYEGTVEYDAWHHMALTWELVPGQYGGGVSYIDGELVAEHGNTFVEAPPGVEAADNWGGGARIGYDVDNSWQYNGLIDEFCLFTRALTPEEVMEVMLGMEEIGPATDPVPEDEAVDVLCDGTLNWTAGPDGVTHDVYLGTAFDDVNDATRDNPLGVLISQDQADTSCPTGTLDFDQTYYWRVDEVNGAPDYTIIKGNVWSFTTEPLAYPIEGIVATSNLTSDAYGPEKTVDGSGLNDADEHSTDTSAMWLGVRSGDGPFWVQYEFDRTYQLHEIDIWNYNGEFEAALGFGIKEATVEYSLDGAEWTVLQQLELAQAPGTDGMAASDVLDASGVAARYVRITIESSYGGRDSCGLSEVQFLSIPTHARKPDPADGATDVAIDAVLSWRAGREAASHDVSLGADAQAVADGTALLDSVDAPSYGPAALDYGTTYYWAVDEVNDAASFSPWEGAIWSFMTQEFGIVDDFEGYDDEENLIYESWIDGWTNGSGSTVGYLEAPFAETRIVNDGRQSMPLEYNNADEPFYSEALRTWDPGQDWTAAGTDSLRVYFCGDADNEAETLYVAIEDASGQVAAVAHADPQAVTVAEWQEWVIALSEFGGVDLANVETLYVGLGNRDNPTAGGTGLVFIDDIGRGHLVDN